MLVTQVIQFIKPDYFPNKVCYSQSVNFINILCKNFLVLKCTSEHFSAHSLGVVLISQCYTVSHQFTNAALVIFGEIVFVNVAKRFILFSLSCTENVGIIALGYFLRRRGLSRLSKSFTEDFMPLSTGWFRPSFFPSLCPGCISHPFSRTRTHAHMHTRTHTHTYASERGYVYAGIHQLSSFQ